MNEDMVELALEALDNHDAIFRKTKSVAAKLPLPGRTRSKDPQSQQDQEYQYYSRDTVSAFKNYNQVNGNLATPSRYDHNQSSDYRGLPSSNAYIQANDLRDPSAQRGRLITSTGPGYHGQRGRDTRYASQDRNRYEYSSEYSISPRPRDRRRIDSRRPNSSFRALPSASPKPRSRQRSDSRRPRSVHTTASSISPPPRNRQHSSRSRQRKDGGKSKSGYISSSSSMMSSTEDERERRRMKIKDVVTAGLATVATIHAANGVYSSMDDMKKRHQEVKDGKLTHQEARRLKNKSHIKDAAAIGVAALSIKGVYSSWKETREMHHNYKEHKEEKALRQRKRAEREDHS